MRTPLVTGMGIGCTAIVGAWVIAQLMPLPMMKPVQTEPVRQPAPEEVTATPSWKDPSIDQEMLERAYAPIAEPLPVEAIPVASSIQPPEQEWRRLERQYDAVAH